MLSAQISPPCRRTMRRVKARPRPCPESRWRCAGAGRRRTAARQSACQSRAPLSDTTNTRPTTLSAAETDLGLFDLGAVLPGIAQQVLQRHAQQRRSPCTTRPGSMSTLSTREGALRCSSSMMKPASCDRLTGWSDSGRVESWLSDSSVDHAVHARRSALNAVQVVVADAVEANGRSPLLRMRAKPSTTRTGARRSCDTE